MAKKTAFLTSPEGAKINAKHLDKSIVNRDAFVRKMIARTQRIEAYLQKEYDLITKEFDDYLQGVADQYATDWQGSATLRSYDETMVVELKNQKRTGFDEKIMLAGQLINAWIDKKKDSITNDKDRETFETVAGIAKSALKTDSQNKIDFRKVLELKKFSFKDQEWQEAMKIINDSQIILSSKKYFSFKVRNDKGVMESIKSSLSDF